MKIKITYTDERELRALLNTPINELIKKGAKVKKSTKNEPYLHCYIEISGKN